jgi:hypothetical protein
MIEEEGEKREWLHKAIRREGEGERERERERERKTS